MPKGFTKKQLLSAQRIEEALRTIIELVPLENEHIVLRRRKRLVDAFASLVSHAYTFGVRTPDLGYLYIPSEYLEKALKIQPALLEEFVKIENGEGQRKIHAVHVRA